MSTSLTTHFKVHSNPKHQPFLTAAGVGFFHFQYIIDMNVHGQTPLPRLCDADYDTQIISISIGHVNVKGMFFFFELAY